ncbi:MAG: hypothetical protein LW863_15050 [Flammeovirgaceae bacterium]|nr:hypothetical protein [Flammeovirgaceae bacterium]
MRIDELSDKEKKELSEAFSKNQLMVKKRTSAEKFFNSPQFLEFVKERMERKKKEENE